MMTVLPMLSLLIVTLSSVLFIISFGQDACDDYYWYNSDFPNGETQDFEAVIGHAYLNQSDFEENGEFYGKRWEDVFWTGVNHTAKPPTSYYRPLGFKYAKLGPWNSPTICLHASRVAGYKVELMVYTLTPAASLCVEDMSADNYDAQDAGAMSTCDSQYIYNCFTADTDQQTLHVAVFCQTNCEDESNVHVLWRFRRSSLKWDDTREFSSQNPEMWCDMIGGDVHWPDEIDEAIPDQYEGVDNLGSSANIIYDTLISLFIGLLVLIKINL